MLRARMDEINERIRKVLMARNQDPVIVEEYLEQIMDLGSHGDFARKTSSAIIKDYSLYLFVRTEYRR